MEREFKRGLQEIEASRPFFLLPRAKQKVYSRGGGVVGEGRGGGPENDEVSSEEEHDDMPGRGLHSSTLPLYLSRFSRPKHPQYP